MILITQKYKVISGTLLSICRPREVFGMVWLVVVMRARVPQPTLRSPDCRRQLEHEAAAGARSDDPVPAARSSQAPGPWKPQPGARRRIGAAPHAGCEGRLSQSGVQPRAVVADGQAHQAVGSREPEG